MPARPVSPAWMQTSTPSNYPSTVATTLTHRGSLTGRALAHRLRVIRISLKMGLRLFTEVSAHETRWNQDRKESEGRLCGRIAGQSSLSVLRGQSGCRRV